MARIALLDDYQGVAREMADWSSLPAGTELEVFHDHLDDCDALVAQLRDFDIVMVMRERTPFDRSLLARLPKLELLVTPGMRNASIDLDAAREHGVTVCGTGGRGHATAELTWGLILAVLRLIPAEDRATRAGRWQVGIGRELDGKTLGVIGLGRLGSHVARVAQAFGMKVMAWSQNLTAERAREVGVELVTREVLLTSADVVSIHLVLSERSRGLIGSRELALMKPSAVLVNTSRGPIVEEQALIEAVRNRRIAGAGLDVYDIEPLPPDHPLRQLDHTVITPHTGFVTEETYRVFYGEGLDDIQRYLAGQPVRVLNPGSG